MKAQLQMQTVRKTRSDPSYTPVARALLWHTHVGGQHLAAVVANAKSAERNAKAHCNARLITQ